MYLSVFKRDSPQRAPWPPLIWTAALNDTGTTAWVFKFGCFFPLLSITSWALCLCYRPWLLQRNMLRIERSISQRSMTKSCRRGTGRKIVTCLRGKWRSPQSYTCRSLTEPTAEVCRPGGPTAGLPERLSLSHVAWNSWICVLVSTVASPVLTTTSFYSIFSKLSSVWLFPTDEEEVKNMMDEFSTFQLPYSNDKIERLLDIARDNVKRNKSILLREIKKAASRKKQRSPK